MARNGLHKEKGDNLNFIFARSHLVQSTILWKLQVAKVGLITWGQRGEKAKFV